MSEIGSITIAEINPCHGPFAETMTVLPIVSMQAGEHGRSAKLYLHDLAGVFYPASQNTANPSMIRCDLGLTCCNAWDLVVRHKKPIVVNAEIQNFGKEDFRLRVSDIRHDIYVTGWIARMSEIRMPKLRLPGLGLGSRS